VATWWRVQRGDLAKDALISVLVGVVLFLGACWWDARLQARQDDLAKSIANRQDDLARDLANHAEVLENTRFVREIGTSGGWRWKPFADINLGGAELGGLTLICARRHVGCADFFKADLHEANLDRTNLSGANLEEADLHRASLDMARFSGANLWNTNLDGVGGKRASFNNAHFMGTSLVQARLDHASFANASLGVIRASPWSSAERIWSLVDMPQGYRNRASQKQAGTPAHSETGTARAV
jgi:hypothetical protein